MDLNETGFDRHESCPIVNVSPGAIVLPFFEVFLTEASKKSRQIAIRAFSAHELRASVDKRSGAILDQFTRVPAEAIERAAFSRSF